VTAGNTQEAEEMSSMFEEYMLKFRKAYSAQERALRMEYFVRSVGFVRQHKLLQQQQQQERYYNVALNKYSDWSDEERAALRGFRSTRPAATYSPVEHSALKDSYASIDWRYPSENPNNVTAVTSIKDQGENVYRVFVDCALTRCRAFQEAAVRAGHSQPALQWKEMLLSILEECLTISVNRS
jgi:hypothetical protein